MAASNGDDGALSSTAAFSGAGAAIRGTGEVACGAGIGGAKIGIEDSAATGEMKIPRTMTPLIEPDSPTTRSEGEEQWRAVLTRRFVAGLDPDFDYRGVDGDGYGESEGESEEDGRQERWFEDEEEAWVGDGDEEEKVVVEIRNDGGNDGSREGGEDASGSGRAATLNGGEERGRRMGKMEKRMLTGETGIQDF